MRIRASDDTPNVRYIIATIFLLLAWLAMWSAVGFLLNIFINNR